MLNALKHIGARISAFFRRGDLDRDFEQELESHLAMATEDNIRRGMPPAQARRAALVRLGGTTSIQQQHRDVRGLPAVDVVLQDLRFAFRLIAKERWLSAAAITTLALGIGVNATGFTIVNAAFLRGLPFEESERLYVLSWQNSSGRRSNVSYAELQDWRGQSRSFAHLAAYHDVTLNISDDRALPAQTRGAWLTVNAFGVLGQQPLLGRDFAAGDDRPGAEPVVILGYNIWKDRYGADANVLGRTLRVNGEPATIIGVMPDRMRFPDDTEVWAPFVPTDAQKRRDARVLRVFGRLTDAASRREAQAELTGIARQMTSAYPDQTRDLVGVRVETFTERYVGGAARPMFITVMGAAVFVLLIACANVANVLLSRSAYRAREIAVRTAMGATRGRVVRQLLIESVVFSIFGASIGLVLAVGGVRAFDAAMQQALGMPYWITFTVDRAVVAYGGASCLLTTMLFGLAPAMYVSKSHNHAVLKEGGRGSAGSRRVRRFGAAMVVTELALTMVLLVGAGLMIRSFMTLYAADLGIDIDRLMTMRVLLPEERYRDAEARRVFFDRLESRLTAIPGVENSAMTTGVPPLDGGERLLEIEPPSPTLDARPVFVSTVVVSPRFFETIGVPIVRGRTFQDLDGAPGAETVVINERLSTQFFPDANPIGRRLRFAERAPTPGRPPDVWRTIVGIAPTIATGSPDAAYVNAVVYVPFRQESPAAASLLVRSALPPGSVMNAVGREVQAIDPDQPIAAIQTLAQVVAEDRWWYRTFGGLLATFAVIALVMSSMGLYSVMAYAVSQRTQEIGVRMAVGAQPRQVSWLILKLGLAQLAIALPIGLVGALALGRVLRRGLVEIASSNHPLTFAAIAMLLTVVSLAACLLPARRATRVDPVVALRAD